MYSPYIHYTKRYFPNSIAIVDSFHIVAWLKRLIIIYLNNLKKKYIEGDRKSFIESCKKRNNPINENEANIPIPVSREVYLLNNFRWLILRNEENIEYKVERKYNHKLKMYLNTYDYEKLFFELHDTLKPIRKLKEKYIEFNHSKERDSTKIDIMLSRLTEEYARSKFKLLVEFSGTLKKHKQEIINSFTYIIDNQGKERRISNGPIEGYNRTPKDFKRNSRGLDNFEYVRCRLIWANRKNEKVLTVPKSKEEIYRRKNNQMKI